jgi:tetratricopeptide (TPR) repeat protein
MKIALAMIVAPTEEESVHLEKCLSNVSPHVDGIFITITGNSPHVKSVAEKYNAVISYYEWDSNFGKARHFNFSQVPKEFDYILWADADDTFSNLDKLRETIEDNQADAYLLFYLYAFDEFNEPVVVHPKTMVIKNDGCLEWNEKDFLHEDFKQNREIKSFFIHGIERVHNATPKKFDKAKLRNIVVAKKHVKELPEDPRSYWNLANSYKACSKDKQALASFDKFLQRSQSDDEKYIARIRMAECHFILGNITTAIEMLRYAIGIKPELPDAYTQIGSFYLEMKQYQKAVDFLKLALDKKPQYHNIVVYNPRDYDYVPMMNLAKAYFALHLPSLAYELLKACLKIYPNDKKLSSLVETIKVESEKFEKIAKIYERLKDEDSAEIIKQELSMLSVDFQAHPMICNLRNNKLIKNESSGKDIVYYCGFTEEVWTPETAQTKGIGGSEEAVINLSKRLVREGWNVTVYNNCGHKELNFDGVVYKPEKSPALRLRDKFREDYY